MMPPNGMAWPRPAPNLLGRGWGGVKQRSEHAMRTSHYQKTLETIATIAIDLDKYTFRLVG